ncbi:cytosine permease [Alkalibacterium putridalgicola]|uniref:Cytosine permease n=1 Tax=Alkalibacterium putridalgicola TaxID=426703 RepID=A0A1H7XFB9_9LACT|nr:cytosine permease [Alkalibacterium putridalgicola]GEK88650.1 cytosine permease [Alkalibacterium putridalgicola]SEM31898.1 cytosine permease [Alkalibacterium putridalgicola]
MDKDFSLQAVPQADRNGYLRMFVVMLGFTFFSASMLSGGELGLGLTMKEFIWMVLFGNFILGAYTGGLAYIAAKTGLSTHLLARYAFGEKGSYLASFLLGATQVGWFGVGIAMFAVPVNRVTGIDMFTLIVISGAAMTFSAFFGMKALAILSFVAVPAIAVLGSTSVGIAVSDLGGLSELFAYQPEQSLGLAAALTICVGSFASGGTLTPDFARFAKTKKSAVLTTLIAFFVGNSLMFLFGAVGSIATGAGDISDVMFSQGLIIPAVIVLGLNIWTTNDNALYASGLGFSNITKISKSKLVVFNGIVGTLLAMWLYNNFIGWLTLLGGALPPIGAIILADYFILNKGHYLKLDDMDLEVVKWPAIFAWIGGFASAQWLPGIPPLNSMIGAVVLFVGLTKLAEKAKDQKQATLGEEV